MHAYIPVGEVHDIEEFFELCFLSYLSCGTKRKEGDPVGPCRNVKVA